MRFYNTSHQYYCRIDLHTKMMYLCILDNEGEICLHQNIPTQPGQFLKLIAPYRDDIVVGVEYIFFWYWLADLSQEEGIPFILGRALYMKAIHGGKSKNDKVDSEKIAKLIRGGTFPLAHVYPYEMRATRDLLRRRNYFLHRRAELQAHIKLTNFQLNLPSINQQLERRANRNDLAERFQDSSVRKNVEADIHLMDAMEDEIKALEAYSIRHAKGHDPRTYKNSQDTQSFY